MTVGSSTDVDTLRGFVAVGNARRCDAGPLSRTTGLLLGAILPWLLVIDPPCEVTRRPRENARQGPRSTPRIATTSITDPVRRSPHTGGYKPHSLPQTPD